MREGFIKFVAEGGALCVLGLFLFVLFVLRLTACTPTTPLPNPDVVVTIADSGLGKSPCAAADAISQARLIWSDGGAPLVVPCPDP